MEGQGLQWADPAQIHAMEAPFDVGRVQQSFIVQSRLLIFNALRGVNIRCCNKTSSFCTFIISSHALIENLQNDTLLEALMARLEVGVMCSQVKLSS